MAIMQIEVEDPRQVPTGMIECDGVPMESDWHRLAMTLLIDVVTTRMGDRQDYFVGGNLFIYFNAQQARTRDYRGPDFFFVWGRPLNPPRRYWAIWEEAGKYPDVLIELSSPTTAEIDRTVKKDIYEHTFRTHEYFIYDPQDQTLSGWRWVDGGYETIEPNERGWLWCKELGLWLGLWQGKYQEKPGTYPRFFDASGQLVPNRGEIECQRADAERQAKEFERQRADAAEAELARLKAQLAAASQKDHPPTP